MEIQMRKLSHDVPLPARRRLRIPSIIHDFKQPGSESERTPKRGAERNGTAWSGTPEPRRHGL